MATPCLGLDAKFPDIKGSIQLDLQSDCTKYFKSTCSILISLL